MANKEKILQEILALEPDLKQKEKELSLLIEKMIKTKPKIEISNDFRMSLRRDLLNASFNKNTSTNKYNYFQIFMSFVVGGATAFSIAGLVGVNFTKIEGNTNKLAEQRSIENVQPMMSMMSDEAMEQDDEVGISGMMEMSNFMMDDSSIEESEESMGAMMMDEPSSDLMMTKTSRVEIANPASQNCIELGGVEETIKDEYGEKGICIFDDGSKCDSWELFDGRCNKGDFTEKDLINYFEKNGIESQHITEILKIINKYK